MVRVKYAAPNATAAARWLTGYTWLPAALLGAAALGPGTSLYALVRAVAPAALQVDPTVDGTSLPLRGRLVRFAVEGDSLRSGVMMALPLLALCVLARGRVPGTGLVPPGYRRPALWIALVTTGVSAVEGLGLLVWTLGGGDLEAQIGYVPDNLLGTALGTPFLGALWTLVVSLVVAGLVRTAWPDSALGDAEGDVPDASRVTSDEAAWDVPVAPILVNSPEPDPGPDTRPDQLDHASVPTAPIVVRPPAPTPYVADLSAFLRPEPPVPEPPGDADDPHGSTASDDAEGLYRRPGSRSASS